MNDPKWKRHNRGWRIIVPRTKGLGWIYGEVSPGFDGKWCWSRKLYCPPQGGMGGCAVGDAYGDCLSAETGMRRIAPGVEIPKAAKIRKAK